MFYVAYNTVKELLCAYPSLSERELRHSFTECVIFPDGTPQAVAVRSALSVPLKRVDSSWQTVRCYVVECPVTAQIRNRYRSKTMPDVKIEGQEGNNASYSDDSLFNIATWGADLSFEELINRYDKGRILKPELQRKYVWNREEASRFIDSLLLGLPVPSIFLAKTGEKGTPLLIIDGYQRIMTVYDYVKGTFSGDNKPFHLSKSEAIYKDWRGKTYQELKPVQQNSIIEYMIHAIIFEQKQPKDDTGMYQVFERINSSGQVLKPQEIRNCVYHGPFNDFLMSLNKENEDWRVLFGSKEEDSHMADVELLLRFFAIRDCRLHDYTLYDVRTKEYAAIKQISLRRYLNEYMGRMNSAPEAELDKCKQIFTDTMSLIRRYIGGKAFRNLTRITEKRRVQQYTNAFHPTIFDAVSQAAAMFVERSTNSEECASVDYEHQHRALLNNEDFKKCISVQTTDMNNLKQRIQLASEALFPVPGD